MANDFDDDIVKQLLSKEKLNGYLFLLRESERELKRIEGLWEVIGKYKDRLWFQESMMKTEYELCQEYYWLAKSLIRYEESIEEYKLKIHQHYNAREYLHKSNMPYKGLNLSTVTLIQQNLF